MRKRHDEVLAKVRSRIEHLNLPPRLTMEGLKQVIVDIWGIPIKIEKTALPTTVGGCSFRAEDSYIILYNQIRTGYSKNFVIAHELGHILRGDAKNLKLLTREEVLTALYQERVIEGILCNFVFTAVRNPVIEREVNLYASLFLTRLVTEDELVFERDIRTWFDGKEL